MFTPEFSPQEQSGQLRAILNSLQIGIQNLPDVYRKTLAYDLRRLSLFLSSNGSPLSQAIEKPSRPETEAHYMQPPALRKATAEPPTEPAYVFGRNVPATLLRQMEMVIDVLDSAVFVYDKDGIIRRTNTCARALLGFEPLGLTREQFLGHLQVFTPDHQPVAPADCPASRAARGETVNHTPLELRLPNGQTRSILASAIPVLVDGAHSGEVSVWNDVTELERLNRQIQAERDQLRESERALREANDRFRVALAPAPITVFTMDRELRYTWIYSQPGLIDEEALGKRDDELRPLEDVEELMEVKWSVIATGQPVQQEVMARGSNGWSTFIITLDPLRDAAGNVTGLTGSSLDITHQRRLEIENLEHMAQMEIQRRLLESREQERQEIARDLHDGPIQLLAGTLFNLHVSREAVEDPRLKENYEAIAANVKGAVQELRDVVNELRPPATIRFGLAKAIRAHAGDFGEKHPELELILKLADDENRLPERVNLNLFRIYQEALNNIARHAAAAHAWVRLSMGEGQAALEVRDDGQGFTVPASLVDRAQSGHFGLLGMEERAESIGGKLEIQSRPGEGTRIKVTVPV